MPKRKDGTDYERIFGKAKSSTQIISTLDSRTKSRILKEMAEAIFENGSYIIEENSKDMALGKKNNLDLVFLIDFFLIRVELQLWKITS